MAQTSGVGTVHTAIGKENNGDRYVQYHQTKVVTWNDKEIVLNTGGWMTNTTRNRMNQTSNEFDLNFSVYQKEGAWYVAYKGDYLPFKSNTMRLSRIDEPMYPSNCKDCIFLGNYHTNSLYYCPKTKKVNYQWGYGITEHQDKLPEKINLSTEPDLCFKKAKLMALSLRLIEDEVYDMSNWKGAGKVARALEKLNNEGE